MRRSAGFSLVELVITCGIVAIMASIAIPAWSSMVARSRQAEAKQNLYAIWSLERSFYGEYAGYGSFTDIGFVPEGDLYGYLVALEGDGRYAGPAGGELNYGGGEERSGGDDPTDSLGPNVPSCSTCRSSSDTPSFGGGGTSADDDDDDGAAAASGPAPGNPHFGEDSFEVVAFGRISTAPPPNDVDVWSIDHESWLANLTAGY